MANSNPTDFLTIGLAQIAPVWLNRAGTLSKMLEQVRAAKEAGCQLVVFGEALLPGYPFWVELTNGAVFNSPMQKEIHAYYMDQAVQIEAGHLDPERLDRVARRASEAFNFVNHTNLGEPSGGGSMSRLVSPTSLRSTRMSRISPKSRAMMAVQRATMIQP